MIPLIEQASKNRDRLGVISHGSEYSYNDLLTRSGDVACHILNGLNHLNGERVCYMISPGFDYLVAQWGIWRAGGVAVPLCLSYPLPSLIYVIEDSQAQTIIVSEEYEELLNGYAKESGRKLILLSKIESKDHRLPSVSEEQNAMILYTSGTTGSPKGVVSTHKQITAQINSLVEAWEWQQEDHIVNVLPLHHIHGVVNVVSCALWVGAVCQFLPKFDAKLLFEIFKEGSVNLFMAVPTIYYKLITEYDKQETVQQEAISEAFKGFRLMVSGSAALPVSVMERWKEISGHTLLERYGMTEIGMALSNSFRGERIPGHVGNPLPGVEVQLRNEEGEEVASKGEIHVKGANVFREYWNKSEATAEAFTEDGWFRTGDMAEKTEKAYRILGRNSVDIIKSGGYKISALEIEEVIRKYDGVMDCAVVGVEDAEWGEKVCVALVTSRELEFESLKSWLKDEIASYKIPKEHLLIDKLPRNVLGKVTKKEVQKLFAR